MNSLNQNRLSARIEVARYVMIAGIVILHLPPYVPLSEVSGLFESIKAFFSHGVFRFSVPVLSAISGFLLFRSIERKKYSELVVSKVRTLAIPMIIWNVPMLLGLFYIQSTLSTSHQFSFQAYPFDAVRWFDGVFGVFSMPVNYPLNFLRDIFALSLLAPCFYLVIQKFGLLGLLAIFFFFWFDFDGQFVLRNQMAINYCCGAWLAMKGTDIFQLDKYRLVSLVVIIVSCSAIVWFEIENRSLFRVLSPFFVWSALSYLDSTMLSSWIVRYSKQSFFIFCVHAPLLIILWFSYQFINNIISVPYVVFWLFSPFIVLILCNLFYKAGYKLAPAFMRLALGGRA